MSRLFNKKAQAIWISWVILGAFAVALGIIVGTQMIQMSEKSSEEIKNYVYDTQECQSVGINIQNICQNPEALNIELANIRNIKLQEVLLRIFDGSGDAETKNIAFSLEPGKEKTLSVGKSRIADRVEILPVINIDGSSIICRERTAEQNYIQDCE